MRPPSKSQNSSQLYLTLAPIFLVGQFLVLFSFWQYLPPEVPLFYSRPWGKEQLVSPLALFILPLLSLTIILINFLLNTMIAKEEVLIKRISTHAAALFNFLCLFTLIQIIRLVT